MTGIEVLFIFTGTSISVCALVISSWLYHRSAKTARPDLDRWQQFLDTAPMLLLETAPTTKNCGIDSEGDPEKTISPSS